MYCLGPFVPDPSRLEALVSTVQWVGLQSRRRGAGGQLRSGLRGLWSLQSSRRSRARTCGFTADRRPRAGRRGSADAQGRPRRGDGAVAAPAAVWAGGTAPLRDDLSLYSR
ncbi:hypothetical protein AAFF_G00169610 [Aldrovandia affinis]|uniref:Uncharacterized protein n=1 Tax=Aldrovandia affinis TaxID=143900 RepID=A0AAD7RLH6_9TELE|nr:hypothetical protein AAFF_G00169610 [Aldrovandia affinis]